MSRIFISHSSGDNAAALAIAQWLAETGWDDYFLDITPERGLAPGERWQAALKAAADRCEAVLFLISPSWQRSRWCLAEFLLAKQLGKAIFGVMIAPAPIEQLPEEMTSEWQLCDLVQGSEQRTFIVEQAPHVSRTEIRFARVGLDRLRIGLQRAGLDPSTFPWPPPGDPDRSPYPGLRALEAEDAAMLFGRDAMIVRGLDQLRRTRERGIEHLFVIVGASGAGKSSFMRAGLLPRLARDDRQFLPVPVIRPERAALNGPEGLLASLARAFKTQGVNRSRAQLRGALDAPQGLASLLRELRDARPRLAEEAGAPPTMIVPIDQGEELFAADAGAEGSALVAHLGPLVAPDAVANGLPHTIVLGSIRADSLDLMQSQPSLQNLPTLLFNLPPVSRGEFKGVIEGPAARHTASGRKLSIDPALTEHLMADAEGADALPLLALTLERLYLEHGADGALTLDAYERMGGLRGSIEAAVDAAFADPSRTPAVPAEARDRLELLRHAFVPWLASVDPDTGERKRRVARWEDIPEASRPLIDRLVKQRLLIKDRRRVREGQDESIVVEVAHEALIRQWPPLRGWLDEEEADLRNLESVRRAAAEWARNEADDEWLVHTGERLDDAEALTRWPDFKGMLGEEGLAYLGACRKRDDEARAEREAQLALISRQQAQVEEEQKRTAEAQTRTARLQRWTKFALAGVAVVLAGTGWWIVKQTRDVALQRSFVIAQNAERVSDGFVATKSVPQSGRALRLSVAAARSSLFAPAHPAAALQMARAAQAFRAAQVFELPTVANMPVELSPDGSRLLATETKAGTLHLYDVGSGAEIATLTGLEGRTRNTFASDDGPVLTWGGKTSPVLWDAKTGRIIARLDGHEGNVVGAVFLSGGTRLITRTQRGAPRLWNGADGRFIAALEGHDPSSAVSIYVSSNGKRVVTRGKDSAARLWDVSDARLLATFDGNSEAPLPFFSHDGTRIVMYSRRDNDAPQLWNAVNGERIASLEGHRAAPRLSFWAKDTRVVTTAGGDAPRLWNAATGKLIAVLGEGSDLVPGPQGDRLMTVSKDGQIRIWDCADGKEVASLRADGGRHRRPRLSAEGGRMWLQTGDNTVEVWDAVNGARLANIDVQAPIRSVSFQRGGALLQTRTADGQQIWDAATGRLIFAFEDKVSLKFSPDDTHLVATGQEGAPQLWTTSGHRIADLVGHTGRVTSAFSRDGARLLTVSENDAPRLWDTATGSLLATLTGHHGRVSSPHFTRDNTRLLTRGSDNEPRLWDLATGQLLAVFSGHTQRIRQTAFSRDESRVLTVSEDDTARVWDAAPPRATLYRGTHPIDHVAATPDGRRLVAAGDRTIRMLRLPEGEVAYSVERPVDETLIAVAGLGLVTRVGPNSVRVLDAEKHHVRSTLVGHTAPIVAASLSPNRKAVVTASADGTARIWNADDGALLHTLGGHGGAVQGAAFSMDGKLIATRAADHVGRLWNAETGRQIASLAGHTDAITFIAISLNDERRVLTTSKDGTARVWDAKTGRPIAVLAPNPGPVESGFPSYDGKRAVTVSDRVASIWDIDHARRIRTLGGSESGVLFAGIDEKGDRVLTVGLDGDIRVWDVDSGKEIASFPGDAHPWRGGLDASGKLAYSLSKEGTVRLWDIATRKLNESKSATVTIEALAMDPSGKHVLVGWSDGIARLHDAETGKEALSYAEHRQAVTAAAFAPDGGRAATGSADGVVRIWDVKSGETLQRVAGKDEAKSEAVTALAFSPDGTLLAAAGLDGSQVRILNAQTGQTIGELVGHTNAVLSVVFSADGARLVTASKDRTARVWDVRSSQPDAVMEGLDTEVRAATLDPTGTRLVTTSADRPSRVWDVETGELLTELEDRGGPAGFAAFTPEGKRVITASARGIVREWDIDWLARPRDSTLIEAVCKQRLMGTSSIVTVADVRDAPLLTGHVGEDVCADFR